GLLPDAGIPLRLRGDRLSASAKSTGRSQRAKKRGDQRQGRAAPPAGAAGRGAVPHPNRAGEVQAVSGDRAAGHRDSRREAHARRSSARWSGNPHDLGIITWFMENYMGDNTDVDDWRCSPARVKSLAGLPPAYVLTAGGDPLCDEGT